MERAFDKQLFLDVVQGIYRLFRVSGFHLLENDAIGEATNLCIAAVTRFASEEGVLLLFARETVIVNGQLVPIPPDTYELAMKLRTYLDRAGINSMWLGPGLNVADVRRLLRLFRKYRADATDADREVEPDDDGFLAPSIRVRKVRDEYLVGLESSQLDPLDRVLLTYALAIRVIRHLHETATETDASVPSFFKRVARQLTRVDFRIQPEVLDICLGAHNVDVAIAAVDTSVVAIAMARVLTVDERVLARVALAAMTMGIGAERHRITGPMLGEDEAISAAVMQMRIGRMRAEALERTLIVHEACAVIAGTTENAVYADGDPVTWDASILATARRFTEVLLDARARELPAPLDAAWANVRAAARTERSVLAALLLLEGIQLLPRGTPVAMNGRALGWVTRGADMPSASARPQVMVVRQVDGQPGAGDVIDLSDDATWAIWGDARPVEPDSDPALLPAVAALPEHEEIVLWLKAARYFTRTRAQRGEVIHTGTFRAVGFSGAHPHVHTSGAHLAVPQTASGSWAPAHRTGNTGAHPAVGSGAHPAVGSGAHPAVGSGSHTAAPGRPGSGGYAAVAGHAGSGSHRAVADSGTHRAVGHHDHVQERTTSGTWRAVSGSQVTVPEPDRHALPLSATDRHAAESIRAANRPAPADPNAPPAGAQAFRTIRKKGPG